MSTTIGVPATSIHNFSWQMEKNLFNDTVCLGGGLFEVDCLDVSLIDFISTFSVIANNQLMISGKDSASDELVVVLLGKCYRNFNSF